ncbi:MAG TPA: DUF4383 domain-containing protein [Microlunatus sp.]|nr:DUF4383 domain-containing protein [Microlunatus sp.]
MTQHGPFFFPYSDRPGGYGVGGARSRTPQRARTQLLARVAGVLFLAIGALGQIPAQAGAPSVIRTEALYLLFGAACLVAARSPRAARRCLLAGGAAFFLMFQYGLVNDPESTTAFGPGQLGHGLHLLLAVALTGAALVPARPRMPERRPPDPW